MKKVLSSLAIIAILASCSKEVPSVETIKVKKTTSVQCIGTTQAGARCKNMTLSSNSKCYLHGGN